MRLFIAIDLPDAVKHLLSRMRTEIAGARWVSPDQIHLTLAFLGDVDESVSPTLIEALSGIHARSFTLDFSAPGCFPDRRHPRVLWVGLKPEPLLSALAAAVGRAVSSCGIQQEARPFSPHITLARLKNPAVEAAAAFFGRAVDFHIPQVPVREFILYQSRLSSSGAIHTPVSSFQLTST